MYLENVSSTSSSNMVSFKKSKRVAVVMEESKRKLLKLLRTQAYREGVFELALGKTSDYYIDARKVTGSAEGAYRIAEIILDIITEDKVDAIGGIETGANAILGAIAAISYLKKRPLSTFYVRKELKKHGTRKWIEGPIPQEGRVAIIDDVTTTGGSILKAIDKVRENTNCEIVKVITLVDRLEGARENLEERGYDLLSIFTINDLKNTGSEHFEHTERRAVS